MSLTTEFNLDAWSDAQLQRVEQALTRWISPQAPAGLGEAMRYAVGTMPVPSSVMWLIFSTHLPVGSL